MIGIFSFLLLIMCSANSFACMQFSKDISIACDSAVDFDGGIKLKVRDSMIKAAKYFFI